MVIQHQEEIDELKVLVERQNRVLDNEPLLYKNSLGVELDLVNDIDGHSCTIYGRNLARFVWPNKEHENYRIADENKKNQGVHHYFTRRFGNLWKFLKFWRLKNQKVS
jgi:hypothetical protein